MENLVGMKEMYDINIRLNQPLELGGCKHDINETILSFDKAEIAQVQESKNHKQATGGYNNNLLIDWEVDNQATFSISHGILSPTTWAVLSNSKLNQKKIKSVPYKEECDVIEDEDYWYCILKYLPNHIDGDWGIQGNPENLPLPMGRKPWLPLKPLPPARDKFIFCYDVETGRRIMNFEIDRNKIIFKGEHRKVMVDYTFDYNDNIIELSVGNRLFNGFLNLTAKMTTKDYITGEPKTAILEIPRLKLSSNLAMRLGINYDTPVVSDFSFIGYPQESRIDNRIFDLTFLNSELTGDYV